MHGIREREKKDLPAADSLREVAQQPGLGQAKDCNQELHLGFLMWKPSPTAFPGALAGGWIKNRAAGTLPLDAIVARTASDS